MKNLRNLRPPGSLNCPRSLRESEIFRARGLFFCLLPLLFCLLTACGDTSENPTLGTDGFVYVAEQIPLSKGQYPADKIQSEGEFLYYFMDGNLYRSSLAEEMSFENEKVLVSLPSDAYFADYVIEREGGICYFVQDMTYGAEWAMVPDGGTLTRMTQDGTIVFQTSLPDADTMLNSTPCLAVNLEGQSFLLTQEGINIIDQEGNLLTVLSTESFRPRTEQGKEQLLTDGNGAVFYLSIENSLTNPAVYEITEEDTAEGKKAPSFQLVRRDEIVQDMTGSFYSGVSGLLCDHENGTLYQYSAEEGIWKEKLNWGDSSLAKGASTVMEASPDTILAHYFFYGGGNDAALFRLDRTALEDLPQKEILVLAVTNSWSDLDDDVAAFNQMNDQCHIKLEIYEGEEGLARLDSALVSDNPPDLLDLSWLDITKYAQKQLLADLNPWLEGSSVLNREDFLTNILEGYTLEGKLYCIPSGFYFSSYLGRTSQVGSGLGWTMEDLMTLTAEYPDSRLLDRNNYEYVLNFLLCDYILEEFINWDTGICSFDGEEFSSLVRWIQEHTKNIYLSYDESVDYAGGVVPADMLLIRENILNPRDYALQTYKWDEPVTFIGYPTKDGHPCYRMNTSDALGIVSGSRHQELAWQFLEFFLSGEKENFFYFSSRRDILEQDVKEEMEPLYERDENGEIVIYEQFWTKENGQMVEHRNEPWVKARQFLNINGEEVAYYNMEQEQGDILMELLGNIDFTPRPQLHNDIISIIMEESAPFLTGDKSLEEVTDVIQNRVSALVQENL